MKFTYSIGILYLILTSCGGPIDLEQHMVSPNGFKMDPYILQDGAEIEIIGKSDKITPEHKIDFYNLVVVRSIETGDTINVLATTFIHQGQNGAYMKFISTESAHGKILEAQSDQKDLNNINMNDLKPKRFNKVFYDKDFLPADLKRYPTIIGIIGDYTIINDVEKQNDIDEAIDSLLEIQ
jgi:hypothetical protein